MPVGPTNSKQVCIKPYNWHRKYDSKAIKDMPYMLHGMRYELHAKEIKITLKSTYDVTYITCMMMVTKHFTFTLQVPVNTK